MKFLESISQSSRAYVIAEAADAHYGSIERAKQMIDKAKWAGADAIKFQHHLPDEEMLPSTPMSSNMTEPLYEFLLRNALSISQHSELEQYSIEAGIQYLCTPFSYAAALELENTLNLPVYKIGSGEMNDFPTIEKIAQFGKPLIVSTGMSFLEEVDETYDFLNKLDVDFALLNCTSAYPPKASDLRIGFTREMIRRYPKALIGFSDHSDNLNSSIAAISLGAKIIEKHVTIDSELSGPDAEVSISFEALRDLVEVSDFLAQALGSEKTVSPSEIEIRSWARRSLVYTQDLKIGEALKEGDIWGKRPGTGVPSRKLGDYLGKTLIRDVEKNTLLSDDDFGL
jgi:N-acetylneuraminate synthase